MLMCDDLAATMAELQARGAQFDGEPRTVSYGVSVRLLVRGSAASSSTSRRTRPPTTCRRVKGLNGTGTRPMGCAPHGREEGEKRHGADDFRTRANPR